MKKIIFISIAVIIVGGALWGFTRRGNESPHLTEAVTRGDLVQTVSANGKVRATSDTLLSFEQQGQIAAITAAEGDHVTRGQVLITLRQRDAESQVANAEAALAAARAEYDALRAGATETEIRVAEVARDNAANNLAQTRARANADIAKAEQTLSEAEVTRAAAETNLSQDIAAKVAAAATAANSAEKKTQGVRNTLDEVYAEDDNFESYFTLYNLETQTRAENSYETTHAAWQAFTAALAAFRVMSSEQSVATHFPALEVSLAPFRNAVSNTSVALVNAGVSSGAPKTITTYRADIATAWTDINAAIAEFADARVTLANARANGEATVAVKRAAAESAAQNLANVRTQSQQSVTQAEGSLKHAQAEYDKLIAPPTEENLALRRARMDEARAKLLSAQTALARTELTSPIDAIVTKINVKLGETVTPGQTVVRLFGANAFEVSIQIPESDIPKVNAGDPVVITLDAFGDEQKFPGTVSFINPAETLVDSVVYYDITILFTEEASDIKPGMSADAAIHTDERKDALSVPLRAVKDRDGTQHVEIPKGNVTEERAVTTGMRTDDGRVEVLSGLSEGEEVVVGTRK